MPDTETLICRSKQRYATRNAAMDITRHKDNRKHKSIHSATCRAVRVYQCRVCGGWHLTSKKTVPPVKGKGE